MYLGETVVEAEALKQLKFHLDRAQDQMAKFSNRHRKPSHIKVGDEVLARF